MPDATSAAARPVSVAVDPPAVEGAFAPEWSAGEGERFLSWIEPVAEAEGGHRVRVARFSGDAWGEPSVLAEGTDHFANWADFPAVARAADGTLFGHWLEKTGEGTYAYGPQVARSVDGGVSWQRLGPLYDDTTQTEHGFVSWLPEGSGVRAVWLDGRAMATEGPMALRSARLAADRPAEAGPPASELLDERICECCATSLAATAAGPVAAYRDRSLEEVRDIFVVRRTEEGWGAPVAVGEDAWMIPGCPVNGPEIVASGQRVAVAWFTGAEPPRVQVAFSGDGGASFAAPVVVDATRPLGRVDLLLDEDGAVLVSWLAVVEGEDGAAGEIRLARVTEQGAEPHRAVATTSAARASGFPRLTRIDGRLYLAWVEVGEDRSASRVRVARIG